MFPCELIIIRMFRVQFETISTPAQFHCYSGTHENCRRVENAVEIMKYIHKLLYYRHYARLHR